MKAYPTVPRGILNAAWFARFGTTMDINDFLPNNSQISSDQESPFEVEEVAAGTTDSIADREWHNSLHSADVNADGSVSPIDALIVINQLQRNASISISSFEKTFERSIFPDTNNDQFISAIDVLFVINGLRISVADHRDLTTLPNELATPPVVPSMNSLPSMDTDVALQDAAIDSLAKDREALRHRLLRRGASRLGCGA